MKIREDSGRFAVFWSVRVSRVWALTLAAASVVLLAPGPVLAQELPAPDPPEEDAPADDPKKDVNPFEKKPPVKNLPKTSTKKKDG